MAEVNHNLLEVIQDFPFSTLTGQFPDVPDEEEEKEYQEFRKFLDEIFGAYEGQYSVHFSTAAVGETNWFAIGYWKQGGA